MTEETKFLFTCLALIVFLAGLLWLQIRSLRIEKPKNPVYISRKMLRK